MNLKRISIIFIASFVLILTVGAISAGEDVQMNETLGFNETSAVAVDDTGYQILNEGNQTSDLGNEISDDGNQTPDEANQTPKNVIRPIKTKVQADQKAAIYKKNSYFIIKVKDKKNVLLKNVKLKVTVKSDNMTKKFKIKTNSKGIAKFNTKGLKIGRYKVSITSADENYTVSKTSKLFVGKKYKAILRFGRVKALKNNAIIKFDVKYDSDLGKEVNIIFKKKSKHTMILKAKFIFYNQKTGGLISKLEYSKFKNGKWYWPDKDYTFRDLIYYAKVYYISTK